MIFVHQKYITSRVPDRSQSQETCHQSPDSQVPKATRKSKCNQEVFKVSEPRVNFSRCQSTPYDTDASTSAQERCLKNASTQRTIKARRHISNTANAASKTIRKTPTTIKNKGQRLDKKKGTAATQMCETSIIYHFIKYQCINASHTSFEVNHNPL